MRQSKTLDETIYERGSEIDITSVFDSQLSPVGQLMANSVFYYFYYFWSTFVDVFDCRLSGVNSLYTS